MQPIILAHGFLGFRRFLLWKHFDGVAKALRHAGYTVLQPLVHPTDSIQNRASQLDRAIRAAYGPDEPVHIIGHSMGGLDARCMASPKGLGQGHRVLTITTIGSPHHGSPVADWIPELLIPVFCGGAYILSNMPFDRDSRRLVGRIGEKRFNGLRQLRPGYIENEFNPNTPDHPAVYYQSYAGCLDEKRVGFPRTFSWRRMKGIAGDNDGMVPVNSAKWGVFRGEISTDHGALVGLRILPFIKPHHDHISFFLALAKELGEHEARPAPEPISQPVK